jgi:hypothetical protein
MVWLRFFSAVGSLSPTRLKIAPRASRSILKITTKKWLFVQPFWGSLILYYIFIYLKKGVRAKVQKDSAIITENDTEKMGEPA